MVAESEIAGTIDGWRALKDKHQEFAMLVRVGYCLYVASFFARLEALIHAGVKRGVFIIRQGQSDESMKKTASMDGEGTGRILFFTRHIRRRARSMC